MLKSYVIEIERKEIGKNSFLNVRSNNIRMIEREINYKIYACPGLMYKTQNNETGL